MRGVKVYDLDSDTPMRVRYVVARSDYDALQVRVAKLEAALTEVKAAHDVCAEMVLLPDDLMARIARLLVNQTEP